MTEHAPDINTPDPEDSAGDEDGIDATLIETYEAVEFLAHAALTEEPA